MKIIYAILGLIIDGVKYAGAFVLLILYEPVVLLLMPLARYHDNLYKQIHYSYSDGWHDAKSDKESNYDKLVEEYENGDKFNHQKEFAIIVVLFWAWTLAVFAFAFYLCR